MNTSQSHPSSQAHGQEVHASPKLAQLQIYQNIAHGGMVQRQVAQGGLPQKLRAGVESLSGIAMHDVRVHYNSSKPAQLQAHAYAQGTDIHIAPGQERHLPHEAWHVVQQKQGRVKPTLQLKGIAINDDHGLEREADVMGTRAMGAGVNQQTYYSPVNAGGPLPVQRVINLSQEADQKSLTITEALDKLGLGNLLSNGKRKKMFKEHILPAWDSTNYDTKTHEKFLLTAAEVEKVVSKAMFLDGTSSVKNITKVQLEVQQQVRDEQKEGQFKGIFTTFGFEHEFADMTKDSPLSGVSHLELAESNEKMPFTGLGYLLETDASNALEFVSPPFLIPTVEGIPLPDPDTVELYDNLITKELLGITNDMRNALVRYFSSPQDKQVSMGILINTLGALTGTTFKWKADIAITPENLSHRALAKEILKLVKGDEEQKHQVSDMEAKTQEDAEEKVQLDSNKLPLDPERVGKIMIGKSDKWSNRKGGAILSQGNFATDLATAKLLEGQPEAHLTMALLYRNVQDKIRIQLGDTQSANVNLFLDQCASKLSGYMAVASQEYMRSAQAAFFHNVENVKAGGDSKPLDNEAIKLFRTHANMSSFVKDASTLWIKDHLMSIALGLLNQDNIDYALETLQRAKVQLKKDEITNPIKSFFDGIKDHRLYVAPDVEDYCNRFWDSMIAALEQTIVFLVSMKDEKVTLPEQNGRELYHHDPEIVGVRQDTYPGADRIQQPGLWEQRLHLAEVRRGGSADLLRAGLKKYRKEKAAKK